MTTRRTFLASIMGVIASVALAQRVVLDTLRIAAPLDPEINPAWVNATYEIVYHEGSAFSPSVRPVKTNDGPRYNWINETGVWEEVPKYAVLLTDPRA